MASSRRKHSKHPTAAVETSDSKYVVICFCIVRYTFNVPLPCLFQWLEEEFIQCLDEWEQEVEQQADSSATEIKMMLLSKETRTGLRMTGTYMIVHHQ